MSGVKTVFKLMSHMPQAQSYVCPNTGRSWTHVSSGWFRSREPTCVATRHQGCYGLVTLESSDKYWATKPHQCPDKFGEAAQMLLQRGCGSSCVFHIAYLVSWKRQKGGDCGSPDIYVQRLSQHTGSSLVK
eukprot:s111_g27.t1